jgi:hypothetical protein
VFRRNSSDRRTARKTQAESPWRCEPDRAVLKPALPIVAARDLRLSPPTRELGGPTATACKLS